MRRETGPLWAALDAGADPAVVAGWIAETQAERQRAEQHQHTPIDEMTDSPAPLTEEQVVAIVEELGDLVSALRNAEPEHKLEVYRSLGLHLTYQPETQTVRADIDLPRTVGIRLVSEGRHLPDAYAVRLTGVVFPRDADHAALQKSVTDFHGGEHIR